MSDILCVLPEGVWCFLYVVCYQRVSGVLYTLCATRGCLVSHIVCALPEGVWCLIYFVWFQRKSGVSQTSCAIIEDLS